MCGMSTQRNTHPAVRKNYWGNTTSESRNNGAKPKSAHYRRMHSLQRHSCKTLENANLPVWQKAERCFPGDEGGEERGVTNQQKETSGVMDMFVILISWAYPYVKIDQIGCLNICTLLYVHYTSIKLKNKRTENKTLPRLGKGSPSLLRYSTGHHLGQPPLLHAVSPNCEVYFRWSWWPTGHSRPIAFPWRAFAPTSLKATNTTSHNHEAAYHLVCISGSASPNSGETL